jgi:tripartite ATP-independent transporter DctP family solute receptor
MQKKLRTLSAAVLAFAFAMATAQARELRATDNLPPDFPTSLYVKKFAETVSQKTGGKLTIKLFSNSALGSEKDTVELLKIGAVDMIRVNTVNFHGIVPETLIPSFPFIFRDSNHFRKVMYGATGDKILAAVDKADFVGLALMEGGSRSVYSKKPIKTLADMKGIKIRVQPSDLWLAVAQAMGANPTPIPMAEVYTALKTNLVDAAENDVLSYETAKHYEAAPFYNATEHVMGSQILVFSKKTWATLTPEEQKILRETARETIPYYTEQWNKKEQPAQDALKKAGVTFNNDVKKAEFVGAMKPVWDKFAPTTELKALIQEIVNTK